MFVVWAKTDSDNRVRGFILEKVNTIAFTHVLTRGPSLSGNEGSVCSQDRGEVLTASLHYWTDSDGGRGSTWRESTTQRVWTEGREWVSEIVLSLFFVLKGTVWLPQQRPIWHCLGSSWSSWILSGNSSTVYTRQVCTAAWVYCSIADTSTDWVNLVLYNKPLSYCSIADTSTDWVNLALYCTQQTTELLLYSRH